MSRLAAAMVVVWLFMGFGLHSAPADAKPQIREARELVSLLRAGRPVLLDDGTTIAGDLNIGPRTVRAPFVCRRCTLTGNIYGSYARFQHGIDLSGLEKEGFVTVADVEALIAGAKQVLASLSDVGLARTLERAAGLFPHIRLVEP